MHNQGLLLWALCITFPFSVFFLIRKPLLYSLLDEFLRISLLLLFLSLFLFSPFSIYFLFLRSFWCTPYLMCISFRLSRTINDIPFLMTLELWHIHFATLSSVLICWRSSLGVFEINNYFWLKEGTKDLEKCLGWINIVIYHFESWLLNLQKD